MSTYEVTFDEFDKYCEVTGRAKAMDFGRSRGSNPVHHVNWYDAIHYCNWLSEQEGFAPCYKLEGDKIVCNFSASGYRLPTEAEWEYAARGGINKENYQYAGSNDADVVSWNLYNSEGTTHPVGTKQPNSMGLYDMTGDLSEWCWDYYDREYYSVSPAKDTTGPETSDYRALRGGDYGASPYLCRVTMRTGGGYNLDGNSGFRVVRSIR
ncbi:MAG: SUMF1/EgtB/PvdO family nonheme iron enzyme [Spirochaetales bacterium]|nr:SUMF1/EgtB/PvdO family nonheme iron enzyme [Spirochaetales bacterium]